MPAEVSFQTKPQIALRLIDRARANGVCVIAWNADELYGRDGGFLDGLDARNEAFVVEIPPDMHVWLVNPKVGTSRAKSQRTPPSAAVRSLASYSAEFIEQKPQRYRIKETQQGPEVWEIRWALCWRKTHTAAKVSRQCTLLVARHVLTNETKYFLANRVPGRDGWSLRQLLRVAFGRWPVEDCFREAKEELGLDHFECRGWRCIHRHFYVTILSGLFCARVREKLSAGTHVQDGDLLTMEQVRRAMNVFLEVHDLPREVRQQRYREESARMQYHQRRNAKASTSHWKTRLQRLQELGIDPTTIKSINP